ncbi:hypothetical protein P9239_17935 [Caballeronia sp. LZ062]|uniref:hypothetical protein n=1 Tax=unclassified Caballeronia TaxID=2646786 RepID=UPI0028573383|nr:MULTISPECIES: hypothetical protein [unclassified Caballeronia]MDR5855986.1 hypothetical protein [Caballeronia sp. LZ050]MDR5872228.1 hypothetical protein [Caballeronia sp. LZ062]
MKFFDTNCQQGPFAHATFGICDDENGGVAYVATTTPSDWVATVLNHQQVAVTFTAIDKCVIKDGEEEGRGRCDGMLTTDRHLYLVELKNQRNAWQSGAIEQLRSTLRFLVPEAGDLGQFRSRKAFACNRRHPKFAVIDNETKKAFFTEFSFRLHIGASIVID